ncbi:MAG: hypothetical protein MJE12_23070 [Alphaproteobacteria bacterium]|nr:hypothetical protein [Alphaproteobacteria bacterium]
MARNRIFTAAFLAGLAAAATATLAAGSDAVTGLVFSPATAAPSTAQKAVTSFRHTPRESAACRTAKRQIDMYSRALSQLNTAAARQHPAVTVYRQARQTEKLWHDAHCRARLDTVVEKSEPGVGTIAARS